MRVAGGIHAPIEAMHGHAELLRRYGRKLRDVTGDFAAR